MKNLKVVVATTLIIFFALISSCRKELPIQQIKKPEKEKITAPEPYKFSKGDCDIVYDNPQKTADGLVAAIMRGDTGVKKSSTNNAMGAPKRVILVKNGAYVQDNNWNNGIPFTVLPFTNATVFNKAFNIAVEHYAVFNVILTQDTAVFNTFDVFHRTTIIVGSTNVLGLYLGYAWNNSYLWGEDTPGFILTNNCNPNAMAEDIGHGIAHESGHMFGLNHEYFTWGQPNTFLSGSLIMGQWQQRTFINWSVGNITALSPILELKDDDYVNTRNAWVLIPANVGKPLAGILEPNDPADVLRFYTSNTSATTFTIKSNGDAPLKFEIWVNGVKKYTGNTNNSMEKSIQIAKSSAPHMLIVMPSNTNGKHTSYGTNRNHG